MSLLVVYSSRTGNTRMVAETALEALPGLAVVVPVEEAPEPDGHQAVAVGFWVDRGGPDKKAVEYMHGLKGRKVAVFGTLGARPDSAHAEDVRDRAADLLEGNELLGTFLCQGRIDPAIVEAMTRSGHHPMTPERLANIKEADKHPDPVDLERARSFFQSLRGQLKEDEQCAP